VQWSVDNAPALEFVRRGGNKRYAGIRRHQAKNHVQMVSLVRRVRDKPRLAACLEHGVVEYWHGLTRREHKGFVRECRQWQARQRGEMMRRRQCHDERLADDDFAAEGRIVDGRPDKADIEQPIEKRRELRRHGHGSGFDLDVLMPAVELADHCRDVRLVRAITHSDAQVRRIGTAYPSRNHGCAIGVRDDVPRFPEKVPTRLRQLDMSFRSIQQARPKLSLELSDLVTQRRLRDMQAGSGVAEVQRLRHGDEISQVSQFH
jgi:hypothetical protein